MSLRGALRASALSNEKKNHPLIQLFLRACHVHCEVMVVFFLGAVRSNQRGGGAEQDRSSCAGSCNPSRNTFAEPWFNAYLPVHVAQCHSFASLTNGGVSSPEL